MDKEALFAILVMALVTAFLRFLPFLLFDGKSSETLDYLGKTLPKAIMGMLVVYCFKDTETGMVLPSLIACISIVLVHIYKKNTLLSILSGSLVYILLVNFIF